MDLEQFGELENRLENKANGRVESEAAGQVGQRVCDHATEAWKRPYRVAATSIDRHANPFSSTKKDGIVASWHRGRHPPDGDRRFSEHATGDRGTGATGHGATDKG